MKSLISLLLAVTIFSCKKELPEEMEARNNTVLTATQYKTEVKITLDMEPADHARITTVVTIFNTYTLNHIVMIMPGVTHYEKTFTANGWLKDYWFSNLMRYAE